MPVVIVPRVLRFNEPAQVLSAVFSTLLRPTLLFARLVINDGHPYEPVVSTMSAVVTPFTLVVLSVPPLTRPPLKLPPESVPPVMLAG